VSFAASFYKYVSLQRVLARKALVAMTAREWLYGKMYPLVSLQIVVSVEALWALIATERAVVRRVRVSALMSVKLLHLRHVSAVHGHWHLVAHVSNKR